MSVNRAEVSRERAYINQAVVPDNSRPAARLDMRPAAVETPTAEADIVPGWLDRLTLGASARTKGQLPLRPPLSVCRRGYCLVRSWPG